MKTIEIVKSVYEYFKGLMDSNPKLFWIVVLANVAVIVFVAFANVIAGLRGNIHSNFFRIARDEYWYTKSFVGKIIHEINMITQFVLIPALSMLILSVGYIVSDKPKLFNDRFYVELIVITMVGMIIKCLLIKGREKHADHFNMETGSGMNTRLANVIILSIIYAFVAFIAIFTDFEHIVPERGPKLFDLPLGAWGYALYVTVLGYIAVRCIGNILSLISMAITVSTSE